MAKRRKSKQTKKKSNKKDDFYSLLKHILWGAIILFVFFIILLFVYNYIYPEKKGNNKFTQETVKSYGSQQDYGSDVGEVFDNIEDVLAIDIDKYTLSHKTPRAKIVNNEHEQIIIHEGYTVSYNSNYKIANWVAYDLTPDRVNADVAKRSNKFTLDPIVKGRTATNKDYQRSGYDRGHLAPAGDMKWSHKAMAESFYFSNIAPQHPDFNRGVWKELEERGRLWALNHDTLYVITGPVAGGDLKRLGGNSVGIPEMFFKVFCSLSNKQLNGIGFLIENKKHTNFLFKEMAISIDSVEKVTGIDFYYSLPELVQDRFESIVDIDKWFFD